jgi:hypothetical protein
LSTGVDVLLSDRLNPFEIRQSSTIVIALFAAPARCLTVELDFRFSVRELHW